MYCTIIALGGLFKLGWFPFTCMHEAYSCCFLCNFAHRVCDLFHALNKNIIFVLYIMYFLHRRIPFWQNMMSWFCVWFLSTVYSWRSMWHTSRICDFYFKGFFIVNATHTSMYVFNFYKEYTFISVQLLTNHICQLSFLMPVYVWIILIWTSPAHFITLIFHISLQCCCSTV